MPYGLETGLWGSPYMQSQTPQKAGFPFLPMAGVLGGGLLGALGMGHRFPGANQINNLFGPKQLAGDTQQLYGFLSKSPAFQQMLSQNNMNASQFQNNLAGNLAQRGLSTTGIGSIANAAGMSAAQTGESALRGGLFNQASDVAQQNLMSRLQAWTQFQYAQGMQPNFLQSLGGSLSSAGGLLSLF